jgi:hypothetical protein
MIVSNVMPAAAKPVVTSVENGEMVRYPLVMIGGTYDGKSLQVKTKPATGDYSFTTLGKKFRMLVKLKEGKNIINIKDESGIAAFSLTYQPPTTDYRIKVWYAVPKGEDPYSFTKHGNNGNYTQITPFSTSVERVMAEFKEKIAVQVELMQSWSAEDMKKAGYGRKTFYPVYTDAGDIDIGIVELDQTREEILKRKRGVFGDIINKIPKKYKDGKHKNLCFTTVHAQALGGGHFCMVGSKTIVQIAPMKTKQIYNFLLNPERVDNLSWREYVGVTIHELGHQMHSAWHPGGRNHIMQSAYGNIARYFTLFDNPADKKAHMDENQSTWGAYTPMMNYNRWFMSPDKAEYKDTKVKITFTDDSIKAESKYPLAVFYYYNPSSNPTLLKKLYDKNCTEFSMSLKDAWKELGPAAEERGWFNVMAIDTQGNMAYKQCKK